MIDIKNLYPNKIKKGEKSYKNILFYHIGYLTVKDLSYATINSVNPLYFILNKINVLNYRKNYTIQILIMMNTLNGVWSDIYILQIIIQKELEKFRKIL